MPTPICRPCIGLGCDNPDDLATGIDSALYSALDYSFIEQCPEGCYCPPGLFPRTISVLASTIPPVIPPIQEPGAPIILRLQGCASLITRTLEFGSTQAEIAAAAQSMQAEWAGQQAICLAMQVPGVNCNPGTSITVCNDAQSFDCFAPIGHPTIPAGTFCQNFNTTGLTAAQITAGIAIIKANLNTNARNSQCNGIVCFGQLVFFGLPGSANIEFQVTNDGSVPFDAGRVCIVLEGPGAGTFCGLNPAVAPGGGVYTFDILPAVPNAFRVTLDGGTMINVASPQPSSARWVFSLCGF